MDGVVVVDEVESLGSVLVGAEVVLVVVDPCGVVVVVVPVFFDVFPPLAAGAVVVVVVVEVVEPGVGRPEHVLRLRDRLLHRVDVGLELRQVARLSAASALV